MDNELKYTYEIGQVIQVHSKDASWEVVLFKSRYQIVTVFLYTTSLSDPIKQVHSYSLTDETDITYLNSLEPLKEIDFYDFYGQKVGSIIEYNSTECLFLGEVEKKILSFKLERPYLFNLEEAAKMAKLYVRADDVDGLANELKQNLDRYFFVPLASKETIEWELISGPILAELEINKSYLKERFGKVPFNEIEIRDFSKLFDKEKLEKIEPIELRDKIKELIKKSLEVGVENMAIGFFDEETKKRKIEEWEQSQKLSNLSMIAKQSQMPQEPISKQPVETAAVEVVETPASTIVAEQMAQQVHTPAVAAQKEPEPKSADVIEIIDNADSLDDLLDLFN